MPVPMGDAKLSIGAGGLPELGKDMVNKLSTRRHRLQFVVSLFLLMATIAVFWQVRGHDFVSYDDNLYVTQNPHVQSGLTADSVIWAFTSGQASNWHPLTWLSHMLDYELYGLDPKGHHLTNLLLHAANTALLFLVLSWMTDALWEPAAVAALFALHPLHIESVAWVAERKDVLSTFFWIITMFAYVRYVRSPGYRSYLLLVLVFALGLMAKPMLVTLPFVLLLLDYWPLRRLSIGVSSSNNNLKRPWRLIREKIPLLTLAAGSCLVTLLVQRAGPALQSLEQFSLQDRLANALVSYVKYMAKMIWPGRLAVYYPHPLDHLPAWQIAGAILLLASMTLLVVRKARSHPYLIVGWLWFLGTLVPVIGIVQVGGQAMADRYTYVPLIGLFISMAWGISSVVTRWPRLKTAVSILTVCVISLLTISTWFELHHWKNSIALFEHALKVTSNNQLAHNNLGLALSKEGRIEEAIEHFSKALLITPQYVHAHINLGNAFKDQGNLKKAEEHYRQALSFVPDDATAKNNLGIVIAMQGRTDEAVALFTEVLRADPDNALAHNNMGIVLAKLGEFDKAIQHFSEALRINPDSASARRNLQQVLTRHGD